MQLTTTDRAKLQGVSPRLVQVVQRAAAITTQSFVVFEGLRTLATQREYVRRGVSRTMNSKHLVQPDDLGHAVDLVPWIEGRPRWEWGAIYPIALAMAEAAQELGCSDLVWGGVWDKFIIELPRTVAGIQGEVSRYCARHPGPDFIDGPHYQLGKS